MKHKIKFSPVYLFFDTQKEVVRVQSMVKAFTASIVATTWYTMDAKHSLYIAASGMILDLFLACIKIDIIEEKKP